MTNTERIQANNAELREAIQMAENLPDAGSGEPIIEPINITENGTYTAPDGVDGYSPVVVNVPVPDGYIKPSGTLNITENGNHDVNQYEAVAVNVPIPDGYVKPTTTKAATTYTPGTSDQTIAAGTYCSGAQTIKGDANLVAENIKSGVSIFGVAGSFEGGGSGGSGGASYDTCTLHIKGGQLEITEYGYITVENGNAVWKNFSTTGGVDISVTCLCRSVIAIKTRFPVSTTGLTYIGMGDSPADGLYSVDVPANGVAEIIVTGGGSDN